MNRYLIGVLAFLGLAILLIVLLFTSGGHKSAPPAKVVTLPSYANSSAQVSMTVSGPITAPQNHNEVNVTIDQQSANFTLFQGYNGDVVSSKIYNNTENSFSNFLYALYYAGFQKGNASSVTDTGYCPLGSRYDFELSNNGQVLEHFWVTSCAGVPRTYEGNFGLTTNLFDAQIPDIGMMVQNYNI